MHPARPTVPRNGLPETSTFQIDDRQTFRYAEAARDYSPYTLDPSAAKALGLPAAIVHGMCTLALIARSIVERACKGDTRRLRRLGVDSRTRSTSSQSRNCGPGCGLRPGQSPSRLRTATEIWW